MLQTVVKKPTSSVACPTIEKKTETPEAVVIEPLNGKFVTIEYNEEFNSQGARLVAVHFNMPIELLMFTSAYQRALENGRLKSILNSYEKNGVWKSLTATINTNKNIVDANHRITCLIAIGVKTIPIVHEYEFTSFEAEVEFFLEINKMGTQIKAPQYIWRAKFMANHVSGLLLYKLVDQDETSALFDKVAIAEKRSTLKRMVISSAWQLILKCGLEYSQGWRFDEEEGYNTRFEKVDYEVIKGRINEFMTFFDQCFGPKERGSLFWKTKIFKVAIHLFLLLKSNNLLSTTSKYNRAVQRVSILPMDANVAKMEFRTLLSFLIDEYNHKKKGHNRINNKNLFEKS